MQRTDQDYLFDLTGFRKEDFYVCLGCKICASVCTLNDLGFAVNPQEVLISVLMGVKKDHPLLRLCTGCMKCLDACPWRIRVPELIRALREIYGIREDFSYAMRRSIELFGRVYEPYVFLRVLPHLLKKGYLRFLPRWFKYMHLSVPEFLKDK